MGYCDCYLGQIDTDGSYCKVVGQNNVVCPGFPASNVDACIADASSDCAGDTACTIPKTDDGLAYLGSTDLAAQAPTDSS